MCYEKINTAILLKAEEKLQEENTALRQRVEQLLADNEYHSKRNGNAKIRLSLAGDDYPFEFMNLKIVDFGVSDNIYIVTCEEWEKERRELRQRVKELEAKASFVDHIEAHLQERQCGEVVICKICGKAAHTIISEALAAKEAK